MQQKTEMWQYNRVYIILKKSPEETVYGFIKMSPRAQYHAECTAITRIIMGISVFLPIDSDAMTQTAQVDGNESYK